MLKSKLKLFIYVFLLGLIIWASIILITNKYDFTPDVIYSESSIYIPPTPINSTILVNFEYTSNGAFIAGKNRPIDVKLTIIPFEKLDLFEKIRDGGDINIMFMGARTYDDKNSIGNIPVTPSITNFYYDAKNNQLYNNITLYYPRSGEYSPKFQYVILKNIKLKVSPLETGLQLINNARIFALTLIIISLSIYSIIPINKNDKAYIEKIIDKLKKTIKLKK